MVRIFGACAVGFSAVCMGATMAGELSRRVQAVTALRDVILLIRQKLVTYRLPLPVLLREAAEEHAGSLSLFCARSAARLERERRRPAEKILAECFREHGPSGLPEEAKRCAMRVFATLGKLDAPQQEEALNRALEELDDLVKRLREDQRRKHRCYWALGLCCGLAVTILLV